MGSMNFIDLTVPQEPLPFEDTDLAMLQTDLQGSFDSRWASTSPGSSFALDSTSCSTSLGFQTPSTMVSDASSRRQSVGSYSSSMKTPLNIPSRYSLSSSVYASHLPLTPTSPFNADTFSPIDWSFIDAHRNRKSLYDNGVCLKPLTPVSIQDSRHHDARAMREFNFTDFSTGAINEGGSPAEYCSYETIASISSPERSCPEDTIFFLGEALRQNAESTHHQDLPQTVVPSETFSLETSPSKSAGLDSLLLSEISSSVSAPLENSSFNSESALSFSSTDIDEQAATGATVEGLQRRTSRGRADLVKASKRTCRTPGSRRDAGGRTRYRRSQNAVSRSSQGTTTMKLLPGTSKRSHRCDISGCERQREGFERIEHLTRHKQSVHGGSENRCVFGAQCSDKKFSGRKDNLTAHYTKTHFFINYPETKGRRRRWVGREEQNHMGLGEIPRECDTERGKKALIAKGLIKELEDGTTTEYNEPQR